MTEVLLNLYPEPGPAQGIWNMVDKNPQFLKDSWPEGQIRADTGHEAPGGSNAETVLGQALNLSKACGRLLS